MTTAYSVTACAMVPAALRDNANALACALGYDEMPGNTFSIPLAPTSVAAPTHYGFNTVATQAFVDDWTAVKGGNFPQSIDLAAVGLTVGEANAVAAAMMTDFPARSMPDTNDVFNAMASANGVVIGDSGAI